MGIWTILLRLWATLSLVSLAIDGACLWIDAHGRAEPLLEAYGINHISLFLWSAPAPFVAAILLPFIGGGLLLLRCILAFGAQCILSLLHHGPMHGLR